MKKLLSLLFVLHPFFVMSQSTAIIGVNDTTNGYFDYPCPLQDFWHSTHAQYLYTSSELNTIGLTSGAFITEIGWIVDALGIGYHDCEGYSISLLNTNVTDLDLSAWDTGATLVYGPQSYYYPGYYAGNVIFPVQPFLYTGGNLIVEICSGVWNADYTLNPPCHLTTNLPFISTHQWREDFIDGCSSSMYTDNTGDSTTRPVMVITFMPNNEGPMIAGNVYYDQNQNGLRDGGEIGVPNRYVLLNPNGFYGITNSSGQYNLYLDTASYSVSWVQSGPWVQTSTPATYSLNIPPNSYNTDFGIWAPDTTAIYSQLVGYVTGIMRCNMLGQSSIHLSNSGLVFQNGSVTLIHSANLPFNPNTSTPGCIVSGDTVRWTYSNLWLGQYLDLAGNFNNGPAGDTVTFTYIDSVFDDSWNFQNVYSKSFTFVVTCSYDPNDKAVNPSGETPAHYTLMDDELQYTIRFQNCGNDTAFNVRILDTLDVNLDISSMEILASSHPVSLQMTSAGAMQFTFSNILLPDSIVDEPNSHGYVVYKIQHNAGLAEGTMIYNTAHIIFDFNPAVVTNTTYNNMVSQIPTGIAENSLSGNGYIYPNPSTDQALLVLFDQSNKVHQLSVYNSIGKKMLSTTFSGNQYLLKEKLAAGMYLVAISDADGNLIYSSRFIKE